MERVERRFRRECRARSVEWKLSGAADSLWWISVNFSGLSIERERVHVLEAVRFRGAVSCSASNYSRNSSNGSSSEGGSVTTALAALAITVLDSHLIDASWLSASISTVTELAQTIEAGKEQQSDERRGSSVSFGCPVWTSSMRSVSALKDHDTGFVPLLIL